MKPNSSGNKGTNFSIYTKNLPNKKNLLDRLEYMGRCLEGEITCFVCLTY